ncbi:MAG TPA: peptide-methionine (S)-S-oxide reductase MsrA [Alkalispirochaeta sp.]|nr:peptide-methionine (S)-S-oxide reductase MsrA [Alkalispirochaeta sp.]
MINRRLRAFLLTGALLIAGAAANLAAVPAFDEDSVPPNYEIAVFAGGCFWCMEPPYDELDGVVRTIAGYTGGTYDNPTYRIVTYTETGHYESVLVVYDPARVTYQRLLEVFWSNIDPTNDEGQFCDYGSSYRSAIFVANEMQEGRARASRRALERSNHLGDTPLATPVLPAQTFWVAEDEHQDYYLKRPVSYDYYRRLCGRDGRLEQLWGPVAERRELIGTLLWQ